MTTDLTDTLDAALEQLQAHEPLSSVLARHPAHAEALAPLLEMTTALAAIRAVQVPSPEALLADKNDYLAEINRLQRQAVSPSPLVCLKERIAHPISWQLRGLTLQRKEKRRMSALLIKASLVVSLIFGSAGGAAALAADSLPDSALYPAKLAMEQMRLSVVTDPGDQASLHLALAGVRVQEMQRLALAGDVPDEGSLLRLQKHLNNAFRLGAQLPEQDLLAFLADAQQKIQTQEQETMQVQAQVAGPGQEPLRQATRLLKQARQDVENGLQDPQGFRWRHTNGSEPDQPGPGQPGGNPEPCTDCEPVGDQNQYGPGPDQPGAGEPGGNPEPCTDCEPVGDQNQNGPQPEQPGLGEPGGNPEPCTDCEPVGGQNQNGPGPEQPGPGEPGGNPEPCTDCEPVGDQNQYGPGPDQPGPGEPGGNPEPCTDCEPAGDQNQNGSQSEQSAGDADQDGTGSGDQAGQGADKNR
jgi:hypothetical protein